MLSRIRSALTYANVMSTLAVFVAIGGGAYAAIKLPANSVGSRQIKSKAVTPAKVAPKTITLFKGQKGDTGPQGPQGLKGDQGIPGPIAGTPAGGALTGTYPNPALADGAVGSAALASGAVTAGKIGAGAADYSALSFVKYSNEAVTFDLPSIPAQSCADISTGLGSNIEADDVVLASTSNLESGLSISTFVEPTTTVVIRVCNVTGAAINPASHDWRMIVLD